LLTNNFFESSYRKDQKGVERIILKWISRKQGCDDVNHTGMVGFGINGVEHWAPLTDSYQI
jgi:hypothetical protein